jgi:hypothetical protein
MAMDLETLGKMIVYGGQFSAAAMAATLGAAAGQPEVSGPAALDAASAYDNYTAAVDDFWSGSPPTPISDGQTAMGDNTARIGSASDQQSNNGTPTNPPAPTSGDNANAIWGYALPNGVGTTGAVMERQSVWQYANNVFFVGRDFRQPHFVWWGNLFVPTTFEGINLVPPGVDFEDVGSDEGLVEYLNRVSPSFTWRDDLFPGSVAALPGTSGSTHGWICELNQYQWDFLKHYRYIPSSGPPDRSLLGDLTFLIGFLPIQYPP